MTDPTQQRRALRAGGFAPIPVYGKIPAPKEWQKYDTVSDEMIEMWAKTWPDARNTSILTKRTPAIDVDIKDENAAEAVEALAREHFEDRGRILVRIGEAPKRLIPTRTDVAFKKLRRAFIAPSGPAPDGKDPAIEILADGQHFVGFGIHPDTRKPYRWFGGEPGEVKAEELPSITQDEAKQFLEEATQRLVDLGYKIKATLKREGLNEKSDKRSSTPEASIKRIVKALRVIPNDNLEWDDWNYIGMAIWRSTGGSDEGLAAFLDWSAKSIKHNPEATREKWAGFHRSPPDRLGAGTLFYLADEADPDWDRVFEASGEPDGKVEDVAIDPCTIDEVIEMFGRWLILRDPTPIYAVLGTIAANLLPGDPVWLGLIAPPSSAKTEIPNSTSMLPYVVQAATVTPAALLSGTPSKQRAAGTKGGLLRQIGSFGIVSLKDFGSILSMRPDAKGEVLAALREIYDGAWTRHLGTDGGKTLEWKGKVGLIFCATGVIDSHYSVIGMGDRFLLSRLTPEEGQFKRALKHAGSATLQMRKELAEAVARLFAGRRPEPRPLGDEEFERLDSIVSLVVKLRGAIERDRMSREIEARYGAEGTARVGLTLERLLAGLDTLGVDRDTALKVVEGVAMDSVPPLRRAAYEHLRKTETADTTEIAKAIGLPTNTVRRALEDLAAYDLVKRESLGPGKPDMWTAGGG